MPKVNPRILVWARETAGFTIDEAVQKLDIRDARGFSAKDRLNAFEQGIEEPSRSLLAKMAKKYRRPLLVFYQAKLPVTGDRGQDFRTLPDNFSAETDGLVDALIRNILLRQDIVRNAMVDAEEAKNLDFVGSRSIEDGTSSVVNALQTTLQFDIKLFRRRRSAREAFAYLRSCVEAIGIYVILVGDLGSHHSKIPLEALRGFASADNIVPFIVVNDNDSQAAWSFTLIHELTHIWLGHRGVSGQNTETQVEMFCNSVASEFLLPRSELSELLPVINQPYETLFFEIGNFAGKRNISGSMVAYKLFRTGEISQSTWSRLSNDFYEAWRRSVERQKSRENEKERIIPYYTIRRQRVGPNLISFVRRMLAEGVITTTKAANVLGVKASGIEGMFHPSQAKTSGQST